MSVPCPKCKTELVAKPARLDTSVRGGYRAALKYECPKHEWSLTIPDPDKPEFIYPPPLPKEGA